jgi:hypothetical protein
MAVEIEVTIGGLQKAKKEAKDLQEQFDKISNDPIKAEKIKSQLDNLNASIQKAEASMKEMQQAGTFLNAKFEDIYGNIQPLTGRIGELEDRLYELALAGQQNTDEFRNIQSEVGNMKKVIIDVDKSVDLLAENQGIGVFGQGLAQIGERLISLDFVGAEKDAKALNNSIGNLGQMGSQAIKGLVGTVKQLGSSFFALGKALIVNPIFLITGVITSVVVAVGIFLNKLGMLKPVFDTIGKALDYVISKFKEFTDWLGFTDNEGEEYAKNEVARIEKLRDANKKASEQRVAEYDRNIKLQKALGKDTEKIERERQRELIKTSQLEFDLLNSKINNSKVVKKLTDEEIKKLKEQFISARETLKNAKNDLQVFEAEQKKLDAERIKAEKEKNKKINDDRRELLKKRLEEDKAQRKLEWELSQKLIEDAGKSLLAQVDTVFKATEQARQLEREQRQTFQDEITMLEEENFQRTFTKDELEMQALNDKYFRLEEMAQGNADQLKVIEEAKRLDLQAIEKEKTRIAIEEAQARRDAQIQLAQNTLDGLNALGTLFINDAKNLEKFQKATALVQIGIDTAKAISSLVASSQANPTNAVTFGASGIAQFASGIVQILTNMAKAKQLLTNPSSTPSVGAGATAPPPSTLPTPAQPTNAQPQVNLFGGANQFNTASNQPNVVKAFVSETEITTTQNKISKLEQLTVL